MGSKKRVIFIIFIVVAAIIISLTIVLNKKGESKVDDTKVETIKSPSIIHSEMGVLQDLEDRVDYQNGNFKLVFKVNTEEDKIDISHNDKTIITTEYNHAAKVRVNIYGNLYIIEIHYPMAQCSTMRLFFLNSDGNKIEQKEINETISRIEYYEDINKIIIYDESCMFCEDCNKKYTYELKNQNFKLIKTEEKYDEYLTEVESEDDYAYYSFNFNRALKQVDDSYEFDIDEYKLKYVLTREENNINHYDFYVNNKKIYSDSLNIDNIKLKKLGKYIIFTNTFTTDVRSTKLYIYDGITLKEIYELDKSNGMVIKSSSHITVNKNGILISGTRINHGPVIVYDDKTYDTYSKETCSATLKELKDDFIVEQDYFYRYTKSMLSTIPETSNKYLLKEYVKNEEFCNSATK